VERPTLQAIQHWLFVLCYAEYSADSFTSGLVQTFDLDDRWQAAVDTLYRLSVCGLIWSPSLPKGIDSGKELLPHIDELSQIDPFPPGNLADEWISIDFRASELCVELMHRFGVVESQGETSLELNHVLELMFLEHEVPYDIYPVKSIRLLRKRGLE
jgi:hypothetical protein